MLIEVALVGAALVAGRKVWRRRRVARPTPELIADETERPEPPRWVDGKVVSGGAALAAAGAGRVLASGPLALASVPLTLLASRSLFSETARAVREERRLRFVVVDAGVTVLGLLSGAYVLAAGSSVLYVVWEKLGEQQRFRARIRPARDDGAPESGWLRVDGRDVAVPVDALAPGDRVVVRAGEGVPVDGRIVDGGGWLDRRSITGHAVVEAGEVGDAVLSGARLVDGCMVVRADRVGADTHAAQLAGVVTAGRREPLEDVAVRSRRVADASVGFTLLTGGLAGLTVGGSALLAAFAANLMGSYRLIGPTALEAHLRQLGVYGVHCEDGRAFELLAGMDALLVDAAVLLDPERLEVVTVRGRGLDLAAALYRHADGPLVGALIEAMLMRDRAPVGLDGSVQIDGALRAARVSGRPVLCGPPSALARAGVALDTAARGWAAEAARLGRPLLLVAEGGEVVGGIAFEPTLRPGAEALIAGLRARGVEPVIVGAEPDAVVEARAERLGVHRSAGGMGSGERLAFVESLRAGGRLVGHLGAGLIDRPALLGCDVAISVTPGPSAARRAADLELRGLPLDHLVGVIDLARAYHRGQGRAMVLAASATLFCGVGILAVGLGPWTAVGAQLAGMLGGLGLALPRPLPRPAADVDDATAAAPDSVAAPAVRG